MTAFTVFAREGALRVESNEAGWAQLTLRVADQELPLGAEPIGSIARKLVAFLNRPISEIEWVLSLSELHFSIYGKRTEAEYVLMIQNSDAAFVATLTLDLARRSQWLDRFSAHL